MSGDDERLGPPIKPKSGEDEEGEFPKSVTLEDGTEVPVGLPPGVDPEHAKLALEYLKQNPTLAKNAVRQADKFVRNPEMSNQFTQMQRAMMTSETYRMQMAALREDPELKPVFDEIAGKGMDAIDKYWNDMELMSKISKRMEAMRIKSQGDKPPVEIKDLHDAAKVGDVEALKRFIEKGDDVNKQDARGITPLGVAVGFNRIQAVECLLQNGADVTLTDKKGNTVLHYAAGYGRVESAEMLLAAGADMKRVNSDGQMPLDAAKVNRETLMIEFLNARLQSDHPDA